MHGLNPDFLLAGAGFGRFSDQNSHSTEPEFLTINVPLFKKLQDIIFFWWDNHFMSHFEGHFEGAKTFLTP
jgi:hypothetical protein